MILSEPISEEELLAIRFYMGDREVVDSGIFQGGAQAYNTINALLHPGADNEKDKAREGRVIELENSGHLKSYLQLIVDIYIAMVKYRQMHPSEADSGRCTYRIDRASSLIRFEQDHHRIAGFFSTCKRGFIPEYAHAKENIVLLEVLREASVPFLDFEELFGDQYAKPEEAELLLPSGMLIRQMEAIPLTEEEKAIYTDINGHPPIEKWRLYLTMGQIPSLSEQLMNEVYSDITAEDTVEKIKVCMDKLSSGKTLSLEEDQYYYTWKMQIQQYIGGMISCRLGEK
jgi:hypothetical protein